MSLQHGWKWQIPTWWQLFHERQQIAYLTVQELQALVVGFAIQELKRCGQMKIANLSQVNHHPPLFAPPGGIKLKRLIQRTRPPFHQTQHTISQPANG